MERATLAYHIRRLNEGDRRALAADLQTARDGGQSRSSPLPPDIVESIGQPGDGQGAVDAERLAEMLCYAVEPSTSARLCETHLGAPPSDLRPSPGTRLTQHLGQVTAHVDRVRKAAPPPAVLVVLLAVVGAVAVTGLFPAATEPTPEAPIQTGTPADGATPDADVDPASWQVTTVYPAPPVGGFAANISQSHIPVVADPADRRGGCDPTALDSQAGLSPDGTPVYYCISGEP